MSKDALSESAQKKVRQAIGSVLNNVLLPYQGRYLMDKSRYLLWEKSRRVGVTWACALKSVMKRVTRAKPIDHLFSSADLIAASEWLGYCRDWSEKINLILGEEVIPLNDWTSEVGYYANGSRAMILSSSPRSFRSKQGDVTLDEYAFHEQQTEIYKAAQPCILWLRDAQLEIISTHNGPEAQFNLFCDEAKKGKSRWSHYRVTLEDAVREGLAIKVWKDRILEYPSIEAMNRGFIDDIKKGCATDEDYEQEYNCCPAKYSTLIAAGEYDRLVLQRDGKAIPIPQDIPSGQAFGELYVGIDCGRVHDLTVVWVIERGHDPKAPEHLSDVYRTICVRWFKNTPFPVQEAAIRSIVSHPSLCGGLIDMGAVGRGLADSVQDETGSIVEAIGMSAPNKAEMAERVRQFVQQKRIALHPDPFVKSDLLCVRRTQTKAGALQYGGATRETHGDFFWALALALKAASGTTNVEMNQIPTQPQLMQEVA